MKTVTMLEFRRDSAGVLKRLAKGETLLLSHRGKAVGRLEPLKATTTAISKEDPALNLDSFSVDGPGGNFSNQEIDQLLYGKT